MGKTKDVTTEANKEVHGTIFDDVFRTIAQKMPYLLIPLINEVFQTNYSEDIHFQQLRNEHYEKLGKIITIPFYRLKITLIISSVSLLSTVKW